MTMFVEMFLAIIWLLRYVEKFEIYFVIILKSNTCIL